MEKQEKTALYGLSLIVSLVGAILLLATEFSGYWTSSVTVWIGLESDAVSGLVLAAIFLFYCAIINLLLLVNPDKIPNENLVKFAKYLALITFLLCAIGGIAFAAIVDADVEGWWFGAGFYGGIIGSLLTFIFMYIADKE